METMGPLNTFTSLWSLLKVGEEGLTACTVERTATTHAWLASDLLSHHNKYPVVLRSTGTMLWIVSDSGWSFDSAWRKCCLSFLTPCISPCLLHSNTTDGKFALCTKRVNQIQNIKPQGARESSNPHYLVALSHCFVCIQGPSLKPDRLVCG